MRITSFSRLPGMMKEMFTLDAGLGFKVRVRVKGEGEVEGWG